MNKLITNDKFLRSWKTPVSRIISCNLFDRPFSSRIERLWIHGGIAILAFLLSNDHNISIKWLRLAFNLHYEPTTVHFNRTIFPCSFVIVFTSYSIIFLHSILRWDFQFNSLKDPWWLFLYFCVFIYSWW